MQEDQPLRLSEAIRIGAMLRPQGFYGMFEPDHFGHIGSCALGAAWEAATGNLDYNDCVLDIGDIFPIVNHRFGTRSLWWHLTSLNDDDKWTRTQIADYVAVIEGYWEQMNGPVAPNGAVFAATTA